jgi:transcriptional regulator with XRE-family HTH domain
MGSQADFGKLLRQWRQHRRLSQLALATDAEISTRHLSFLETGRSAPSRQMIIKLAEELQIPLRQRNILLTAGGYADIYPERPLNDPGLRMVGEVVQTILAGHEPNPAMAIDHCWNVLAMNRSVKVLIQGVSPALLEPPLNSIRLALHPEGLGSRVLNLREWRAHVIGIIQHRTEVTADRELIALLDEVRSYRYPNTPIKAATNSQEEFATPFQLATPKGNISLVTTSMVFGFPRDVTVSELAIECLFPKDKESATILHELVREG